jgi:hypothetical protein
MKSILLFLSVILITTSSCRWMGYKQIKGNGNIISQDRKVNFAERIKLAGSFDVEITQGPITSVKVEADENLLPYIFTDENDGFLVIKTKDHVSLSTDHTIKVYITTNKIEQIQLAGSGNIIGKNKFTGSKKLTLKIAGSGDMTMDVNSPEIVAEIAGSGNISLTGETKDETIKIAGVGDLNADGLKAENVKVKIAGSGNVKVFADLTLDISIAGVGSVYYKGGATVKQHVSGSGEVKKIE